jgi:excisionase family DNA binding protein
MKKHDPNRLLPIGRVAKELGLTKRLAKQMIAAGRGPTAIRVGAWVRVRRDALDEYKRNHPVAPAPATADQP